LFPLLWRSWSRRTQELIIGQLTARLMEEAVPFTASRIEFRGLSLGDDVGDEVLLLEGDNDVLGPVLFFIRFSLLVEPFAFPLGDVGGLIKEGLFDDLSECNDGEEEEEEYKVIDIGVPLVPFVPFVPFAPFVP
jgi:hypothetical protein